MQTLAETDAPGGALTSGTWVAAALSAGASLLHWITTSTDTHSWSGDAVVSLVAGAALMGLAIVLVARPWSVRAARTVNVVGGVGTALVVIAFILPVLSAATSGHAGDAGHAGHDVGGGEAVAAANAVRTVLEVALVGVLLWMHRMTGPAAQPVGQ
jgi:hypothetical protein